MCATVCPSGALWFGSRRALEGARRERPAYRFRLAGQVVRTKVGMMLPPSEEELDVTRWMGEGGGDVRNAGVEGRLSDLVGR